MSDVIVGLDIGTSAIRTVVAEKLETGVLQIIGVGSGYEKEPLSISKKPYRGSTMRSKLQR